MTTSAGLKLDARYDLGNDMQLLPYVKYTVSAEGNTASNMVIAPVSAPDYQSNIIGVPSTQYINKMDLGFKLKLNQSSALEMKYLAGWATGYVSQTGFVNFSQKF